MKAMLVKKLGMATVFEKNQAVATTVFEAVPNIVVQIKNSDKDGYNAIKIGYPKLQSAKSKKKASKDFEELEELRTEDIANQKVGDKVAIDQFSEGEKISVIGKSSGKGFAGVIKRHHFARGPKTHGSDHHRATGSIGSMFPQRVVKGKRMPGRMGGAQVTVKNLQIIKVDPENNFLILKGAVPGKRGSIVFVKAK